MKSKGLHRIFDAKRASKEKGAEGKVKCSCSEGLGVYGLLRLTGEATGSPVVPHCFVQDQATRSLHNS